MFIQKVSHYIYTFTQSDVTSTSGNHGYLVAVTLEVHEQTSDYVWYILDLLLVYISGVYVTHICVWPGGELGGAVPLPVHEQTHALCSHDEAQVSHQVKNWFLHLQIVLNVSDQVEQNLALLHQTQRVKTAEIHRRRPAAVQEVRDNLRPEVQVEILFRKLRVWVQEELRRRRVHHDGSD